MAAEAYRFDYTPIQLGQYVQQGYDQGVARGKQSRLASLASQAYASPDNADQYIQQAIGVDPQSGYALQKEVQGRNDDLLKKSAGAAQYFASAVETGDEAKIKGAWQAVRPFLAQTSAANGGAEPPQDIDIATAKSMLPNAYKIIAAAGTPADRMQGNVVKLANGHYGAPMQSGVLRDLGDAGSYAPEYDFETDADGHIYRTDKTKGTAEWVMPGGGQSVGQNTGAALSKAYQDAIAGIESNGSGGYSAIGPATKTGDRAYGKYQVMGANIPQWTLAALGKSMTPQEFLANPQAQDAVFNSQFGKYVQQYGPEGAARAWFGGPGNVNNPNAKDVNGMTVGQYGQKFVQGAGAPQGAFTIAKDDKGKQSQYDKNKDFADNLVEGGQIKKDDTATYNYVVGHGKLPGADGESMIPSGNANLSGAQYLSSIKDPSRTAQIKALAEGRMAFPTGQALKSPYWQQMLTDVAQYDNSFDAVNYNARANTRKAFTSGKEAGQVNALNTVSEHLGQFSDDIEALNNSKYPLYNRVANAILSETGDPRIAKANTDRKAVADEVAKVWRASGGSEADIQENLKNLDLAQSPAQLHAAVGALVSLIKGKVDALQEQYDAGMGTTQSPRPLISPKASKAYNKVLERAGMSPDMQQSQQNNNSGWSIQRVQ